MRSLIALVPLCVSLLSSASPLGSRDLFRKHSGAPLARRFILSSRFDAPAACAAIPISDPPVADNSTITSPDLSNITDSNAPDNSTLPAPIAVDNSTVSDDNSTVTDLPADANATAADNSTTAAKRYAFHDFEDAWLDLCTSSGGDIFDDSDPCFELGINGYSALFAEADVCAQQENADAMITFAKSQGVVNSAQLIDVALAYRQLSRESVEIMGFYPSTPYCTIAPINPELGGVWNDQPQGVQQGIYGGPNYPIVPFGDDGSCPYGQTPDVNTCSCISNSYGGIGATATSAANVTVDATPSDTPDDSTVAAGATPTDAPDLSSTTAEPSSSAAASDSVETDAASSTSAAPDVNPSGLSGDVNDPNGK
ncbi:hypothetical protein B0H17DRAFT_236727 [Mycena rosella]|uniref:Uncharacterized protein n=1 Tax=Mycena rosella TaxID=1033263 RepID=A0AAD7H0Z6_MYCRO|nr:hypothetical protein B0H17DRAFT_236727 [Mycena rosella]